MKEKWKYISDFARDEEFARIDFHDAVVNGYSLPEDRLILHIEAVNILAEHSLNPYPVAKRVDDGSLEFANVRHFHADLYEGKDKRAIQSYDILTDLEILELRFSSPGEFAIFGITDRNAYDGNYCEIAITAGGAWFKWMSFADDAWFVG
ncbi:hypothetical protein QWJ34_12150 [Saccharibacillus sp. CPCC 101409]|uniref:hypothetical protein n=1 Tax=Saccharibacillus sp. CPCC 101409 TaxID=3058041 RepID=UPI0026730250|nr:hypothetical protein [Saccharibacillus sp. CPCC 101409]MDO3410514.1 hypothetical protein [Saccharibacillus sp. CPCC 101409]